MPISPGENYLYLKDLLSKNSGAYIAPKEYERYGNIASNEMFDDFLGRKTNPRIVLGKNRLVDTRLLPFKKKANLSFSGEVLTKPANCAYISAVYTTSGRIPVKPLDDDRQAMIMQDPLASPNDEDKYYVEGLTQLTLLGEDSLAVTVEYYERPTPMVYAFTEVSGRPVYNDAGSTYYQWDKSEEAELTNRILEKAALSMRDVLQLQTSNNKIAQE